MRRSPPSLWVPWHRDLYSTGSYIIKRRAMQYLLGIYLPGSSLPKLAQPAARMCGVKVRPMFGGASRRGSCIGCNQGGRPLEPQPQLAALLGRAHHLLPGEHMELSAFC